MRNRTWKHVILALGVAGCTEASTGGTSDAVAKGDTGTVAGTDTETPSGPDTAVTPQPVPDETLTPDEKEFKGQFAAILEEAKTLDYAGLRAEYPAPTYATSLGYDASAAAHLTEIKATFEVNAADEARIAANGFVVLPGSQQTPSTAFDAVYRAHLPLLITSDSVLHALHQSFDDILKALELGTLSPTVSDLLEGTHEALQNLDAPGGLGDARRDVDVYLSVARSLLAGKLVAPNDAGAVVDVEKILAQVGKLSMDRLELFGGGRPEDFSQFEPRGHYTETEELKQYFRAMMWVGRIDFRFKEFDPDTGLPIWNDRQIRAAWLFRAAMDQAGGRPLWARVDGLIGALMGEIDSLDFTGFDAFAAAADLATAETVGGDLISTHAILETGRFGKQRISSHYLATNPYSPDVTPLPVAFTVLGQRYIIDSHVMSNAVYDRIVDESGTKMLRAMPMGFDPLFVLGSSRALDHLESEVTTWKYAGNLQAMRFLVDDHDASFWENSVYNLWLSAIRDLNAVPEGAAIPSSMRTKAWADKALHSQLASWAELRHDTILYAKQSYTGGAACEYPDAYVEPYPALYGHLAQSAQRIADVVATVPAGKEDYFIKAVADWAARWTTTMPLLAAMATKELADEAFSAEEQELISNWIAEESLGCTTSYTGTYPKLLFDAEDITEFDPTVADIHTNPNEVGPLAPARVLHVGTGFTNLLVLTRQSCDGVKAYVGPVTSYYEFNEPGIERLTDEEWRTRIYATPGPARPAWVESFMQAEQ